MRFILESQPSAHLLHCTVHAPDDDYKRPLAVCTSIYKIHLRCLQPEGAGAWKETEKGARHRAEAEAKSREREQKREGGGG